jgi:hypothetical protein
MAIGLFFNTGAQAATFTKMMKLGVVSYTPSSKVVVIYSEDQTKCLSTQGQNETKAKSLVYQECLIDDANTWVITSVGKIKNKLNGKCLSTPRGGESLELVNCNYRHFRDYKNNDFVIFKHLVEGVHNGLKTADISN